MNKTSLSSLSMYISIGVKIFFTFLISVYIIRYLSTDDYGAYKLIASILTFAAYCTSFGLSNAIVRFVPEYLIKREYKKVNRLIIIVVLFKITIVFLFIIILHIFKNSLFSFLNLPNILMVWLGVISLIIFFQQMYKVFGVSLLDSGCFTGNGDRSSIFF